MKAILCVWIFLFAHIASPAQEMHWTPEARNAYNLITALRIDEGLTAIKLQSITNPNNLIWPYLEDYGIFLKIFVQEDLLAMDSFFGASDIRLERIEAIPSSNPLSLMAQGQIALHQCAIHLQQGKFIVAGTDINRSFKLLRKNQKLHPNDVANLRLYASLKVVFGAIPDKYRLLVSIVTSLSGTIEEGLEELNGILQNTTPASNIFFNETVLYTALAEGRLNNKPEAGLALMKKHYGELPKTESAQYLMANLLIAAGENDKAIRVLSEASGVPGSVQIPFLDFMLGECKLFRGDADANIHLKDFLVNHKGKHFIKEAYQKLAWYALLAGQPDGYKHYMQQVLIKGSNKTDEDQQAMIEAETHAIPNPKLLRSRLYYDGGYYDKALALMNESLYSTLLQHEQRLEYLYRKGRILQAQQADAEALHYLMLTITTGQFERYYFACSAALQCGLIHEKLGSMPTARKFYNMCLEMEPEAYSTGLHQKARMGLNRTGS